jgi:ribosome biogenesis GTPase A
MLSVMVVVALFGQGDIELAGARILNDYRKGLTGAFSLEAPPKSKQKSTPRKNQKKRTTA